MSFRKIKHIAAGVAAAAVVGVTAALSGCALETSRPRARITFEFNGTEYTVEYQLYRDMYPQTVRHFIELADAGFYDGTIIHDYTSNDIYGGGYKYDAERYESDVTNGSPEDYLDDEGMYLEDDYYELFKQENSPITPSVFDDDGYTYEGMYLEDDYYELFKQENSPITPSVFDDDGYTYEGEGEDAVLVPKEGEALPTLYGEFSENGHTVENGQRGSEYGALKMYYSEKIISDTAEAQVWVKTGSGETLLREYQYNSATSLFAIQTSASTALDADEYATFGYLLNDDAEAVLDSLMDAIDDYIDEEYNSSRDFTVNAGTEIDRFEQVAEQATAADFDLPKLAIIIRSVEITRY